ncbi:hypothetical protein DsansV1_C01g0007931 [Dioscorea sansibarensis]
MDSNIEGEMFNVCTALDQCYRKSIKPDYIFTNCITVLEMIKSVDPSITSRFGASVPKAKVYSCPID